MAEITFRIPSKAVTYGYVEIPVTLTDDPAPEALASMYVNYVYAFQKEEQAALKRIAEQPSPAPTKPLDVGVPGAAEQRVESDLKPRTVDEANDMAAAIIKQELGATEVDEDAAPWDRKVAPSVKPWETETLPPALADPTW